VNGYYGAKCEMRINACSYNPCGEGGVCHLMSENSLVKYYCTCAQDTYYGTSCNYLNVEPNPCKMYASSNEAGVETFFKSNIDPSIFVQCDGSSFYLKQCPNHLAFSPAINRCDWNANHQIQPSSYVNYQTQPSSYSSPSYQPQPAPQPIVQPTYNTQQTY
jgi:hypothetical protein